MGKKYKESMKGTIGCKPFNNKQEIYCSTLIYHPIDSQHGFRPINCRSMKLLKEDTATNIQCVYVPIITVNKSWLQKYKVDP